MRFSMSHKVPAAGLFGLVAARVSVVGAGPLSPHLRSPTEPNGCSLSTPTATFSSGLVS